MQEWHLTSTVVIRSCPGMMGMGWRGGAGGWGVGGVKTGDREKGGATGLKREKWVQDRVRQKPEGEEDR